MLKVSPAGVVRIVAIELLGDRLQPLMTTFPLKEEGTRSPP